jgi:hypothetical protein
MIDGLLHGPRILSVEPASREIGDKFRRDI